MDYLDRMSILKNEMSQNIADIEGMKTGHLTIGGAGFFNTVYLPKAVGAFVDRYPGISIEIIDGKVPELVTDASKRYAGSFITPFADEDERFVYEELLEETIYICVPSDWDVNREFSGEALRRTTYSKRIQKTLRAYLRDIETGSAHRTEAEAL